MSTISTEELRKVPYLDTASLGDRVVNLMPLWDGKEWHLWVPGPDGLVAMKPANAVEADYVARRPASESDLLIPFVEFMWQRVSYPEICPLIKAISDDFHNMGTSVAKLHHFFGSRHSLTESDAGRFAATELEYVVILARTVFDLLQETVARIWQQRIRLLDSDLEKRRRGRKLPNTFSKMVLCDKRHVKSPEEIEREFGVPTQLAVEYAKRVSFFWELRSMRDDIVHGGSGVGLIFATEKGFCVDPHTKPFSSFEGWSEHHRYNENLVSVLPWVASVVLQTIDACNALMLTLASVILFPPEIAPGFHVFVRGPSTHALANVLRIHEGGSPWWNEENGPEDVDRGVRLIPKNEVTDN